MNILKQCLLRIKHTYFQPQAVTWQSIEYFDISWKNRIKKMVSFIPDTTNSIVDLGCGKMWLKEFLSPQIVYYGVDYTKREASTLVCNLNYHEFPNIKADCYFLSGIIEYIEDVNWLFETIAKYTNTIILSYCSIDNGNSKQPAWVNHFSRIDILNHLQEHGFKMEKIIENYNGNDIILFVKTQ